MSWWVVFETVTLCSCIASNIADCVLGVARLISSAKIRFAKIGPFSNLNSRNPWSFSMIRLVPTMSAGIRSGVNCILENWQSIVCASVRTSIVFPNPGTPSKRALPPAKSVTRVFLTNSFWPTITVATSSSILVAVCINWSGLISVCVFIIAS